MALQTVESTSVLPQPINVVGSSTFGRYPKISIEKTYNMFISDDWLVNFAGWKKINVNIDGDRGRALFHSVRGELLILVVDRTVYELKTGLTFKKVGDINSNVGEVVIDENLESQICIVDGTETFIYNYKTGNFTFQDIGFGAGYVTYHNTFFLIAPSRFDSSNNKWRVFDFETPDTIKQLLVAGEFPVQTKPDVAIAIKRLPGRANHIIVFGNSVAEVWSQVGGTENYRRNSSFNIDYGCVSPFTIAANEEFVCWLAFNENNSPSIMITDGSQVKRISSDGIDHLLQTIKTPEDSTAFFFRQDGHLFYVLTFFNDLDDITLSYDFTTQKFFHLTDEKMNHHPARQVAYFDEKILFAALKKGSLFEMSTDIIESFEEVGNSSNEGRTIPRIRVCNTVRLPHSLQFRCRNFTFWIEQGDNDFPVGLDGDTIFGQMVTEESDPMITEDGDLMFSEDGFRILDSGVIRPAVDLSFSKNGNQSFGTIVRKRLNSQGLYRNQINWYRIGMANEITLQLRFWGMQRFVANDGILEIY